MKIPNEEVMPRIERSFLEGIWLLGWRGFSLIGEEK
jgi:hypothetical protein